MGNGDLRAAVRGGDVFRLGDSPSNGSPAGGADLRGELLLYVPLGVPNNLAAVSRGRCESALSDKLLLWLRCGNVVLPLDNPAPIP